MKKIAIIPARKNSTRLPNKLLLKETGKYLIEHTIDQVKKAKSVDEIYLATDDKEIYDIALANNVNAFITDPQIPTGTDRIASIIDTIEKINNDDIIINIQGDEPEIDPQLIDNLVTAMEKKNCFALSAAYELKSNFEQSSIVKVALSNIIEKINGNNLYCAHYFSRAKIPYLHDQNYDKKIYAHVGIYLFTVASLKKFVGMEKSSNEKAEGLEQLRIIDNFEKILILETDHSFKGIDILEEYEKFVIRHKSL